MSRSRAARRSISGRRWRVAGSRAGVRFSIGALTWASATLILLGYELFPGRVSLPLGERSPVLVRAPRTAQYVDLEETERLRREAERQVSRLPLYAPLPFALADAEKRLDKAFAALAMQGEDPSARRSLSYLEPVLLEWASIRSLDQLEELRQKGRDILRETMSQEIRPGTADLESARRDVAALAGRREKTPKAAALLAIMVGHEITANRIYDEEATRAAKVEARARVQEVVRTIAADYPIILPGERVTRQQLAVLQALGLTSPGIDYRRAISIALIVGLIVGLLGAQTRRWANQVYHTPRLLLLLSLLLVTALFLINLLALSLSNPWMLIVPAASLMGAVLLQEAVGLALALCLSLLVGLMANGGLVAVLLSLGSAVVALSCVHYLWPVSRLRWIVGITAVANMLLVVAASLLQMQPLAAAAREIGFAAILYSPGAAALSLGGIFLLQRPFGITTHLGLLELSNPQHPLLRRLQAEAPGTYYASETVASLADAGAEVVGADALLARVGALYHDIGKLQRPAFFVENQGLLGLENVHDRLSSSLSGLVILSHVKDGVELARAHRLPSEVVEIVEQHHGTTLVSYFYQRALSGEHPEAVTEEHFRYPGPLPRSKEAALVMLADSIQAAAKAIAEPTPQRVQQMVRDLVRDRVVDGQLAECDLTFRDLAAIEATMARILSGLLCHTRIEYPEAAATGPGA